MSDSAKAAISRQTSLKLIREYFSESIHDAMEICLAALNTMVYEREEIGLPGTEIVDTSTAEGARKAKAYFKRFGLDPPVDATVVIGLPLPDELLAKLGSSGNIIVKDGDTAETRYKLLVGCLAAYMFAELGMEAKEFATTQLVSKLSRMLGVASDKETGSYLPGRGAIRAALGVKLARGEVATARPEDALKADHLMTALYIDSLMICVRAEKEPDGSLANALRTAVLAPSIGRLFGDLGLTCGSDFSHLCDQNLFNASKAAALLRSATDDGVYMPAGGPICCRNSI